MARPKHSRRQLLIFRLGIVLVGIASSIWLSACGLWYAMQGSPAELYVINADGSNPVRLRVEGTTPSWSPDGTTIAFLWSATRHEWASEIKVVNPDGTALRSLTRETGASRRGSQTAPVWSRDGKHIATYSWDISSNVVMNADGSGWRQVDRLAEPYLDFRISPDGKKQIVEVFHKNGDVDVYVRQIDGTEQVLIARNINGAGWLAKSRPWSPVVMWGWPQSGSWFPDSKRIAFTYSSNSSRGPLQIGEKVPVEDPNLHEIYIANADGSGSTKLGKGSGPVVSPDGSKIAFLAGEDIWVMNSDGTNRFRLTSSSAIEYTPAWSPDSKKIVFVMARSPKGFFASPL